MLPHLYGRFLRPLPRSAIARLPSGASPAEIAASKMRCARLAAPFVTALCMFDLAPRRLSRSSLAPAHQASALSPFIDNPRRNASSPATPLLARGRPRSLPCLRLVAPVENRARLGFASLASRFFALPRRSRVMVSSRAYSSPVPQPASRHCIKPFSIHPLVANIRCTAVSISQNGWRSESGFIANVGYDDEKNLSDACPT